MQHIWHDAPGTSCAGEEEAKQEDGFIEKEPAQSVVIDGHIIIKQQCYQYSHCQQMTAQTKSVVLSWVLHCKVCWCKKILTNCA